MEALVLPAVAAKRTSYTIFIFVAIHPMTIFPEITGTSSSDAPFPVLVDDSTCNAEQTYEQDGVEAREIAQYIPYFPFKGIDRFYDIGGFLYVPHVFEKIVNIFVNRYQTLNIDVIAGYVI